MLLRSSPLFRCASKAMMSPCHQEPLEKDFFPLRTLPWPLIRVAKLRRNGGMSCINGIGRLLANRIDNCFLAILRSGSLCRSNFGKLAPPITHIVERSFATLASRSYFLLLKCSPVFAAMPQLSLPDCGATMYPKTKTRAKSILKLDRVILKPKLKQKVS